LHQLAPCCIDHLQKIWHTGSSSKLPQRKQLPAYAAMVLLANGLQQQF
jgi:hypothetical protein